jgi:hypothetical protein
MASGMRTKKRKRPSGESPAGVALAESEKVKYLNPEFVADKGYLRLQKGKSFAAHSKYTDLSLAGPLIRRGLGEGYLYRLNYDVGGKPLLKDFFLMVEENLTGESSHSLFTRTPWLKTMLTLIQLHTRRKTPSQRTPYIVSIKSGTEHIKGSALRDLENESLLIFRFYTEPMEANG